MFFPCERKYYSREWQNGGDEGGKGRAACQFCLQCDCSDLVSGIVAGNWKQMCSFWCASPRGSLSFFLSSSYCLVLHHFFSWLLFTMETRIPRPTRPFQNTHFPTNKDFLSSHSNSDGLLRQAEYPQRQILFLLSGSSSRKCVTGGITL